MQVTSRARAVEHEERVGGVRRLAPPPRSLPLAGISVIVVAAVSSGFWVLGLGAVHDLQTTSSWRTVATVVVATLGGITTALLLPGLHSFRLSLRSRGLAARGDIVAARRVAAQARENAQRTVGAAFAMLVLLAITLFLLTNNAVILETFFSWDQIRRSTVDVLRAGKLNLWIAAVSEAVILVWSLTLALVRLAPGRAIAPVRWLAILYIDVFRAIPLIIVLYLVAFGIPIAEIPVLSDLPTAWLIIIGLTLTTSAYVAEVFRAGIQSVHWSQTAAAKSLGFSTFQTSLYVVVPQATRRVVPPLLSYFIGLQKDTALVLVVGAIDIFGQAKIYAGNYFNLSSVTLVAIVFILITIPQTRFVDYLIAREAKKTGARTF
jgi:polar amino acid transport system permease protein